PPERTTRPPDVVTPTLLTMVSTAVPPENTPSTARPERIVPDAVPPAPPEAPDRSSAALVEPLPETNAEIVLPPPETTSRPPALTVIPRSRPPEETNSRP